MSAKEGEKLKDGRSNGSTYLPQYAVEEPSRMAAGVLREPSQCILVISPFTWAQCPNWNFHPAGQLAVTLAV